MADDQRSWRTRSLWQHLLPAILLVGLGLTLFSTSGRDDSHITYWAAYSLSHEGEITNYNGERIEQSSSLLQVILLAGLHRLLTADLVTLGYVVTILVGVLTLTAVRLLGSKLCVGGGSWAALLTASSGYFVYWSFGGLESTLTPFLGICLILSYAAHLECDRRYLTTLSGSIVATLLFALTRPEAPLVLVSILAGCGVFLRVTKRHERTTCVTGQGERRRRFRDLLAVWALVTLLIVIFRIWYFGSAFPQPVLAKLAGLSWLTIENGLLYLRRNISENPSVSISALAVLLAIGHAAWRQFSHKEAGFTHLLALLWLVAYTSFIVLSGGDWMEGGRFIAHMLPVGVAFLPCALWRITSRPGVRGVILSALVIVQVAGVVGLASNRSFGMPLWQAISHHRTFGLAHGAANFSWFERTNRVHARDLPQIHYLDEIVRRLYERRQTRVCLASMQAGMICYHIAKTHGGRIRMIDLLGITDEALTGCHLTAHLPRGAQGVDMSYRFYFSNMIALERDCAIPRPDIIFDLRGNAGGPMRIERQGYEVIYAQHGACRTGSSWLPGAPLRSDSFIAVRKDLMPALDGFQRVRLDFEALQPWDRTRRRS